MRHLANAAVIKLLPPVFPSWGCKQQLNRLWFIFFPHGLRMKLDPTRLRLAWLGPVWTSSGASDGRPEGRAPCVYHLPKKINISFRSKISHQQIPNKTQINDNSQMSLVTELSKFQSRHKGAVLYIFLGLLHGRRLLNCIDLLSPALLPHVPRDRKLLRGGEHGPPWKPLSPEIGAMALLRYLWDNRRDHSASFTRAVFWYRLFGPIFHQISPDAPYVRCI